jgi:hypothetical protein
MQQDVGVTVANETVIVRYIDAAQAQRPARFEAVRIFADADSQVSRGRAPGTGIDDGKFGICGRR